MNINLKCVLLDDELPGLQYLRLLCEQANVEVVKAYNDPVRFLEETPSLDFDFCILDIAMPVLTGLQVAELLKDKPIIFATAHKEFALDAFDLDALDYIQKPIKKERLDRAITKVTHYLYHKEKDKKDFLNWTTNKGKTLIFTDQILRITTSETDKRDKLLILNNNEEIVLKNISFDQLLNKLPANQFCRVNKRDIIALKIIKFYSFDEITTSLKDKSGNNISITLSNIYRPDFQNKVLK